MSGECQKCNEHTLDCQCAKSKMKMEEVVQHMRALLMTLYEDIIKADRGNKAAAQRVRTGTILLEKLAKIYRKQSAKLAKIPKKKGKNEI